MFPNDELYKRLDYCIELAQLPETNSFIEDERHSIDWTPSIAINHGRKVHGTNNIFQAMAIQNPKVDFYRTDFGQTVGNNIRLFSTVNALVPISTEEITINQLIDFRSENLLRRAKFYNAADALVKSFGEASTEEEVELVLDLTERELREQFEQLKKIYKKTNIKAALVMLGAIGGTPALINYLGSALSITCWEPASFVASTALAVIPWLNDREDAIRSVNASPWAYLWYMKQNLG